MFGLTALCAYGEESAIAHVVTPTGKMFATAYGESLEVAQANADLIAAALDMQDALAALINKYIANQGTPHEFVSCITPEHMPDYWTKARAALNKSRGR